MTVSQLHAVQFRGHAYLMMLTRLSPKACSHCTQHVQPIRLDVHKVFWSQKNVRQCCCQCAEEHNACGMWYDCSVACDWYAVACDWHAAWHMLWVLLLAEGHRRRSQVAGVSVVLGWRCHKLKVSDKQCRHSWGNRRQPATRFHGSDRLSRDNQVHSQYGQTLLCGPQQAQLCM